MGPDGAVFGVLYPTRGCVSWFIGMQMSLTARRFGDLDVKAMAGGKPVVLATPDGVGLEGNEAVKLEYSEIGYLVVASYVADIA